jgi:hypothetical protein
LNAWLVPLLRDGSQIHLSIGIFTKHQVKTMAYQDIVPLVGARRHDLLAEALGALDVKLSDVNLAALARALPPGAAAGGRYPASALAYMDSEKRSHELIAYRLRLAASFSLLELSALGQKATWLTGSMMSALTQKADTRGHFSFRRCHPKPSINRDQGCIVSLHEVLTDQCEYA